MAKRLLVSLTLIMGLAAAASAADAPVYTMSVWVSEKGLPPGDVFAIEQDAEGYLWLGTPTGLLRFDGQQFVPWASLNEQEPLPNAPVLALVAARHGNLWVGFGSGGGVARIERGRVIRYTPDDGAPQGANAMLEDRQGVIWAAGRGGLFRYVKNRWSAVTEDEGYPTAEGFSLYEDRSGRVWVGTTAGVYVRAKDAFELVDPLAVSVQSFAEDQSGAIWVTDGNTIVKRLMDRRAPRHAASIRLPTSGWRLLADRRGHVWVAAFSGGLLRVTDTSAAIPSMEPFEYEHRLAGSPRSLHEDREGNVWVGMRGGLLRLSESSFDSSMPLDGLTHEGVRTTAVAADGSVWVATGHSLNRFLGDTRSVYSLSQTLALHIDRHGTFWASTTQGLGQMKNGRFVPVSIPEPIQWNRVMSITTDSSDLLWLCSRLAGVMGWDGRKLLRFEENGEISNRACERTFTDSRGRVWIGFQGGGAAVHDRGSFQVFGDREGLTRGTVLAIIEDKSGAVWFSTTGGVSRYQNGRVTSITQANAPLVNLVPVLVADEDGYIWVGIDSGVGIIRFHPREVDKIAANPSHHLEYALYDETDGMQSAPLTWQTGVGGVRARDGRLWVTSGPGVAIIDPRNLPRSRRPPAPLIQAIVADGHRIQPQRALELPARTSTVRIDYGTVSLSSASKLRFRYRLEGFEDDWVYAGQRRDTTYTKLPSGDYRFLVSTTADGQWTEAGVWEFSVAPPLYLTRWFLTLATLGFALMLASAWWLRMRAVRSRYALVFAERARVSREIHDTLLQSLAALGVELEAIASQLDSSQAQARDELRRVRREVGHSLRDARESILELRRDAMTTREAADALRELADKTTRSKGIRVDFSVTGRRPQHCSADVDLQLLRIGQEAVANAIRHGRAGHIQIEVAYEKDRVVLKVCDNGCGFAPEEADTGRDMGEHLGLQTMRERAARVRGRVSIVSTPGTGTTIETMIPVPEEVGSRMPPLASGFGSNT